MIAPPLVNPYCTLNDVQIETQNTDADDVPTFLTSINKASREIDWFCNRDFLFHDYSTVPLVVPNDWCAQNVIYLPWPVITLTSISTADLLGSPQVLPPENYVVENPFLSATGKIIRSGRWLTGDVYNETGLLPVRTNTLPRVITLTGTFGYAPAVDPATPPATTPGFNASAMPSPSIPQDIQTACAVIASVRSGKARRDIVDFSGNRTSATLKVIPKDIQSMICRYRREVI